MAVHPFGAGMVYTVGAYLDDAAQRVFVDHALEAGRGGGHRDAARARVGAPRRRSGPRDLVCDQPHAGSARLRAAVARVRPPCAGGEARAAPRTVRRRGAHSPAPSSAMFRFGAAYYPEHWPEERWPEDARLMQEAGFNVVRLAEFAWAKLEPSEGQFDFEWLDRAIELLARRGIDVVLGTPTASPPPWAMAESEELFRVGENGIRQTYGLRREYCPNQARYRKHSLRIVSAIADDYRGNPSVTGWQIDNELGERWQAGPLPTPSAPERTRSSPSGDPSGSEPQLFCRRGFSCRPLRTSNKTRPVGASCARPGRPQVAPTFGVLLGALSSPAIRAQEQVASQGRRVGRLATPATAIGPGRFCPRPIPPAARGAFTPPPAGCRVRARRPNPGVLCERTCGRCP